MFSSSSDRGHFSGVPEFRQNDLRDARAASCFFHPWQSKDLDYNMPVFTLENGRPLTVSHFGSVVNKLLEKRIRKVGGYVTGHSFRAGIPWTLAMHPDLVSDYHIMGWGRWSSSAYLCSTKLKLCQKRKIFEKIVNVLNK